MQINKKLSTIAITAILILSILAVAAPANAITGLPYLVVPSSTPDVSLARTSGSVGTKVGVVGNSTNGIASPFSTVNVYWDTLSGTLLGTVGADSTGAYAVNVTIPAAVNGAAHFIVVKDDGSAQGAAFTVTAKLTASVTPSTGATVKALPGDSITLTGSGYSASSAITVAFTAPNTTTTITLAAPTITTNATGSFSAVVTVPATILAPDDFGTWTITATDASSVVNANTVTVSIDYYVTVTPTSGPSGITVTIAGRIPANKAYSVNFGSAIGVFSGTSSATGTFTGTYTITGAVITGGAYVTTVIWDVIQSRSATFTGAAAPTLTLGAPSGVAGAVVTISGAGFSASASITLSIGTTVVNSTATDSRFGPTSISGAFTGDFAVPAIAPGIYTLTVTDQYGASTGTAYSFTVLAAPVTTITTAASFAQGDTISFSIVTTEASFTAGPIVTILDPAGTTWFVSLAWPLTGTTTKTVLFQDQLVEEQHIVLPANAPLGSWNWTVTYTPQSTGVSTKATGLFTVNAVGVSGGVTNADLNTTLAGINSRLDTLNSTILGIGANVTSIKGTVVTIQTSTGTITTSLASLSATVTSISGSIATLQTSMGIVTTSVSSLSSSISSISSGMATVQTSLGSITTSLSSIDAVLGYVAGDTANITTSLGTVTTSLSSINPVLTSIQNGIATIKTDVGTLQGTVTSISNGVATIQTGVGTLQTNVGNLQTDVTSTKDSTAGVPTLVYIAIVLALVAAIAAVASIVLMRRKIAG